MMTCARSDFVSVSRAVLAVVASGRDRSCTTSTLSDPVDAGAMTAPRRRGRRPCA
jgi:hypothetical protein